MGMGWDSDPDLDLSSGPAKIGGLWAHVGSPKMIGLVLFSPIFAIFCDEQSINYLHPVAFSNLILFTAYIDFRFYCYPRLAWHVC